MEHKLSTEEKIDFKNRLKQFCHATIERRIASARESIATAQSAANGEEKSSAGDKYETSRAMNHLEKDMHSRQLGEHLKELAALHSIDTNTIYSSATMGAYLQCAKISFFFSAGLGKKMIDGTPVLFLSHQAPLGKILHGKKAGDHFSFNGSNLIIEDIF
ncbi:MAG: hypothetical protein H7Y03_08480 [Chitinophagaceae bacterium]|nr:hypothetical protein [Chitinophagaceae bacterium]